MTTQNPSLTAAPQLAQAQDPLAQLQDIHLPPEIGFWPPAWGWWLLAAIVIAAICALVFFINRHKARNAYRSFAIAELKNLNRQYGQEQNSEYLQGLSVILRRTALSGFGHNFNASLKGHEWLLWLDSQCAKTNHQFSQGVGTALLTGPYQKSPEFDRAKLHNLSSLWIKEHRNQWRKPHKAAGKSNTSLDTEGKNHV